MSREGSESTLPWRVIMGLRWAVTGLLLPFSLWMALYRMPLSAAFGVLLCALVAPLWRPGLERGAAVALVALGILVLFVWNVSLREYAQETRRLGCLVRVAQGIGTMGCDGVDLARAAGDRTGPLFTWRERQGIRGFNVLLALGGELTGFDEVAWETLALDFASDPGVRDATLRARRRLCRPGAASGGPQQSKRDDFAMASPAVRRAVSTLAGRAAGLGEGQELRLGPVPVPFGGAGGGNNTVYSRFLAADSTRVALALYVPDGAISGRARREGGTTWLDLAWTGGIYYPAGPAFSFPVPTLLGKVDVRVDESLFCGLQMDGAFVPYGMTWEWTVRADDPRLRPDRQEIPDRTLFERAAALVLGVD